MQNYIITTPAHFNNEYKIINDVLSENLAHIHIRKPDFSLSEMESLLKKIDKKHHPKLVIHSHHELVNKFNLKGIHFTQHNKRFISEYANYKGSKSISTHSTAEIQALTYDFNYYFLSPVFQSVSKPDYGGNQYDFKELASFLKANSHKNIVALGGVTASNINQIKEMGFYGAAILGSFWQYAKLLNQPNQIRIFFNELNNMPPLT